MGWDFHHEVAPYDRRAICRRNISDKYEVVKDSVVGTTYYAALRCKETGEVYALVILTQIWRGQYCNFGMKWLDESCGPGECSCPKAILELLSPTDNKYALEWREECWAKINEPKDETLKNAPKENTKIMDTIKTLGDFRKLTKDLDDDFVIEFRVRRRVPEEELKKRRYPYPYDTEYFEGFEFDDIGWSDKEVCFGVCLGNGEI